jgi:hypothetical protein
MSQCSGCGDCISRPYRVYDGPGYRNFRVHWEDAPGSRQGLCRICLQKRDRKWGKRQVRGAVRCNTVSR